MEAINVWLTRSDHFCIEKEIKETMKEEEIEKNDCRPQTRSLFLEILLDLKQAVPNQVANEVHSLRLTRTLIVEGINVWPTRSDHFVSAMQ